MDTKIRRWGFSAILVMMMLMVLIITSHIVRSQNHKLQMAEQKVAQLKNSQKVNEVVEKEQNKEVKQKVSGLNTDRVKTDDAIMTTFLNECLNWKSYAEYKAAYDTISSKYQKAVSPTFFDTFFPEIKETKVGTNPIDEKGLNLKFEKLTSHVIQIDSVGDAYTYFGEVKVTSDTKYTDAHHDTHTTSGVGTIAFIYTINGDGILSNVSAYTVVDEDK